MKFCVKKSGKTTNEILKGLTDLEKNKLQVGHFSDQGYHPTAKDDANNRMTYVDLMRYHHNGNESVYPRPVIDILSTIRAPSLDSGRYKRYLQQWTKEIPTIQNNKALLEGFGKNLVEDEQNIFGDTSVLELGSNPTPLIDTGELKKAVTYKIKEG